MKKCTVIINPNSGKGLTDKKAVEFQKILYDYKYDARIIFTLYRKHAEEIVEKLDDDIDLVISVGGDGTFSEVMNGNLKRKKRLVLAHLPVGTANDIGHMYGLGNDITNNLKLILEGTIKDVDIGYINNRAFTYVASYGKFMDIPYKTPQELKRRIGYMAYVIEILKRAFTRIPKHEITFTIDGVKHQGKYTFILISNANRIAGIDNFYSDIKLDDYKFEVMLCSLRKKIDILKAIYTLKTSDISYVSGIELYKCSSMNIVFKDKDKAWCVDGEEFEDNKNDCEIGLQKGIKMLIPNANIKKLFVKND